MQQVQSLSVAVAAHVAGASFATLPAPAVEGARRALLDALGVMLAATGLSAETLPYHRRALDEAGVCTLLGSAHRTSPGSAAFANGALAHALDFGDCFDPGPAHPHAALVPGVMAIAELRPSTTFGEFLTVVAVGGDLACRLSLSPRRSYETGGWYPPPLVNLISAAAACARLHGLGASSIVDAMSFALLGGAFPAALKYDRASPLRGVREAFAARAAVEAALLAGAGAAGFGDPLGGPGGYFEVYGDGCRDEVLLEGLGTRFLGAEVSFKPWPACRGTHAYIEAALKLRERGNPHEIVSIHVGIGPIQEMLVRPLPPFTAPLSPTQAKFSIPFTLALAFLEGDVTLESFSEARLSDEALRRFGDKVHASRVEGWGREHAASGRLEVVWAGGTSREIEVMEALGAPSRPLSDEDLVRKFVDCARHAVTPLAAPQAQAFAEAILSSEPELPLSRLLQPLSASSS